MSYRNQNPATFKPKPEAGTRDQYQIFRPAYTRWADNDVYGHVNNAVQYFMFDTAINEWLIENQCLDPKNGKQIGLVVESSCTYFGQISFPESLEIGIRIGRVGNSSVCYEVGIFQKSNHSAASEGTFTHVYVDSETYRPVPINASLRHLLESTKTTL